MAASSSSSSSSSGFTEFSNLDSFGFNNPLTNVFSAAFNALDEKTPQTVFEDTSNYLVRQSICSLFPSWTANRNEAIDAKFNESIGKIKEYSLEKIKNNKAVMLFLRSQYIRGLAYAIMRVPNVCVLYASQKQLTFAAVTSGSHEVWIYSRGDVSSILESNDKQEAERTAASLKRKYDECMSEIDFALRCKRLCLEKPEEQT